MPEPFRNLLNPELVQLCARHLARAWPDFDRRGFQRQALDGLESLEMKARAMQIADALEANLPADFDRAAGLIEASLAPAPEGDRLDQRSGDQGLAGWIGWPLGEFIARRGLSEPERALRALHALTQRFTAEFAIRPFLVEHFDSTLRTLMDWTRDPSPHVRRLVSEGSRPRLPWGPQLKRLVADPGPTLPLLAALHDDSSEYVRRSVANHLNDIARDHPAVFADWLDRHLPDAPEPRRALLRHASRTLIKRAHPQVLEAWGLGRAFAGSLEFGLTPDQARVGDSLALRLALKSSAKQPQKLAIDYRVHHVRANGSTSPKVFKGWTLELAPGESRELARQHSLRPITTRRYYPGRHRIEIQVNGRVEAEAGFELATD